MTNSTEAENEARAIKQSGAAARALNFHAKRKLNAKTHGPLNENRKHHDYGTCLRQDVRHCSGKAARKQVYADRLPSIGMMQGAIV